jgi:hypothetical protein
MPTGIIMQSSSAGATQEAIEKVLAANGYETTKPEPEPPAEPKREDFPSQEAYAKAHDEFLGKEKAAAAVEPSEPKREDFPTEEEFEVAQEEFEAQQEEAEEHRAKQEEAKRLAALPKKTRRQKAIEKATRELKDELRRTQDRLAALEKGGAPKPAAASAEEKQPELPKAPRREDFKTDAEYDDALFDYRYQMRRAKEEQDTARKRMEQTRQQTEAQLKKNFENYQSQVAAFKEEHDDWDEVVNQSDIPIHESVYLAVQEQENGAQVTYYLGKHPDFARRLSAMSPLSAVMEIGRLAERLKPAAPEPGASGAPKKTPPIVIPEPVRPVSTSATSSTLTAREAASRRDYKAFKAAQRRRA